MNNTRQILIFDSGVGGFTIVKAIRQIAPEFNITYVADNAKFPYGSFKDIALCERIVDILDQARTVCIPDAIIIACNTASTIILAKLRQHFDDIPILGVVPPIKPAAQYSRSGVIGLLATSATVQRKYIDDLISQHAPHCRVVRVGSSKLAKIAEDYVRNKSIDRDLLSDILQPLLKGEGMMVDAVALGCTHYPLLLDEFKQVSPARIRWFDPASAVAHHLVNVLSKHSIKQKKHDLKQDTIYFTKDPGSISDLTALFNLAGLIKYKVLSLPLSSGSILT